MAKKSKSEGESMYKERTDGRAFDELRKIEAKVGIIPNADGSAMYKSGESLG